MDTQIRNAKAVVDIDEVHFLKHVNGEPTITQALLDQAVSEAEDANNWFSVATLKGTVEIAQDALDLTKINIDQSNMPIGISTEPGDFNINFSMPSLVSDNLKKWLDTAADATTLTLGNKQGQGYDFNAELIEMVMAIKTKTGEWFIFPNTQGSVALGQEDKTFVLNYSGSVIGATNEENSDVYILSDNTAA